MPSLGQGRLDFDADLLDELGGPVATDFTEDSAKASVDALLASASRYASPAEYRALVSFIGRLPRYSPFNRMLVHIQDPGARYVATASRWRSEFGRGISPDARPIIVLQPRGPVLVVFDVRHTEAVVPDRPQVPTSASDPIAIGYLAPSAEIERRWERITHNATRDGIRIVAADHGGHSGGPTTPRPGSGILLTRSGRSRGAARTSEQFPLRYDVLVNRNLALRDRYATLVHELAHIYCGHLGSPNEQYWPSRPGGTPRRSGGRGGVRGPHDRVARRPSRDDGRLDPRAPRSGGYGAGRRQSARHDKGGGVDRGDGQGLASGAEARWWRR